MGSDSEQVTTVTIYNRTYHVRSGGDPEHVLRLARFVDEKMLELSEHTSTVDTLKIAVLAALNIADEYVAAQDELENLRRALSESSERITERIDSVLDSASS